MRNVAMLRTAVFSAAILGALGFGTAQVFAAAPEADTARKCDRRCEAQCGPRLGVWIANSFCDCCL